MLPGWFYMSFCLLKVFDLLGFERRYLKRYLCARVRQVILLSVLLSIYDTYSVILCVADIRPLMYMIMLP